jgi:hypothetical protein
MGLEVCLQPWGYIPKAILFGRPHGDQLPQPCQKGAEFISLGVRPGPGVGRTDSAKWAKRARRAHPSWPTSRWPWQSHALGGD